MLSFSRFHLAISSICLLFLQFLPDPISGHGYMYSPRSRNWVAHEDGADSWSITDGIAREYCYHCLNAKTENEVCGTTSTNNYDEWLDISGNSIPWDSQETYTEGEIISIGSFLSTNHKGHQDVFICADYENPTQECFEEHPLEFIEDLTRGAPKDPNYPYRGMYAPDVQDFVMKFRLPMGVTGDRVMMQWRYVTANSCVPPGYLQYPFPEPDWLGGDTSTCSYPLDPTGARCTGCPEQFWNCAEITILPGNPTSPTLPPVSVPVTSNPTVAPVTLNPTFPAPTEAPTKKKKCKKSCAEATEPWEKKCKWKECKGCEPCKPTNPPAPSPTTNNDYCCTWDMYHCGVDGLCNENSKACQVDCGGTWLSTSSIAMQCIAKYLECTVDVNSCCGDLNCIGNTDYKQCM